MWPLRARPHSLPPICRRRYNEEAEPSKCYVKFNLQKLLETAVHVTNAQHCTKVLKCREGLHNKAFVLTMDNGTEVVAKLPNPNAGPAHYTTASEVATQTLLREVLGLPVPRVIAWSSDASTHPVEAEFIIEEKAAGVRLGSIDADLESETIDKYYQAQVCKRAPRHWAVLQQPLIPLTRKPSLMWIARSWGEIVPGDVSCPIAFTTELELHSQEEENIDGVGRVLALFRDQGVLPVDGMVEPQDYAVASENNRKFRKVFIESAGDEAERRLFDNLWPYQEQRD
ncbi:aminoglycoside phosphotransferase [Aspergillus terreus]|uniref:Altered inheritance of mitochondria protein 9, mitochondrial n=1 Tax=Aspergillus terreus TaxID=33178 RepID=A0A8H3REL9_ASPTE|nr:aminoglycoside phosphotransferase [Aspergillus terreus]